MIRRLTYLLQKLLVALSLVLGVSLCGFFLLVFFGPDQSYQLLGKNPSPADLATLRQQLGSDLPFWQRYGHYLTELLSFDFGYSHSSHEKVASLLRRTWPISMAVTLPGFFLGNSLALSLALLCAYHQGQWQEKVLKLIASASMSVSLLIAIILFQLFFCSEAGLDLFPVHGWEMHSLEAYIHYATVPTLASSFVAFGYNSRFFYSVVRQEYQQGYVRTAQARGCSAWRILCCHVLKNCLIPLSTRLLFSLPATLLGGSLLIESYFSIPGLGSLTYEALSCGDLPVVKAVLSLTALSYALLLSLLDAIYGQLDPRLRGGLHAHVGL